MRHDVASIVEQVNKQVFADMEKHGLEWTKCWTEKHFQNLDGHYYSGFNILWLYCQPFKRQVYGTYLQWQSKGLQVQKGSKAIKLILYRPFSKEVEKTDGSKETKFFKLLRTFNVFNIEQVKGNIKPWDNVELKNKDTVELSKKAEEFIKNTEAKIEHNGNKACYIPSKDFIRIPEKKAFIDTKDSSSTANYYGVLFHELTHWTGHDSRLKREFKGFFGSPEYAFEELVAELGSAYACNQLDIAVTPRLDHACYLKSWMRAIKDNKQSLIKASGLANKALTFMNEKQPIHEISAVA